MPRYNLKLTLVGAARLRVRAAKKGWHGLADIANGFGVSYSALQRVMNARSRSTLSPEMIEKFCTHFQLSEEEFLRYTESVDAELCQKESVPLSGQERAAFERDAERIKSLPDLKAVIHDESLSDRLLFADSMPTLAEAARTTSSRYYERNKDKEGEPYTHYLQVSCSLLVTWPTADPRILVYSRQPLSEDSTQFQNVQGISHLWAASYETETNQSVPIMQHWLNDTLELSNERATQKLLCGERGYLRQLLGYKLKFMDFPHLNFSPNAIITNDQRPDRKRVYTQYWFLGAIEFDKEPLNLHELANSFGVAGYHMWLAPLDPTYESKLVDPRDKKPNRMDVLAWRYLCGDENDLQIPPDPQESRPIGRARLKPGFTVVA